MTFSNPYPRTEWPRLLSAVSAAEIKETASMCEKAFHQIEDLIKPQSGLALLQLRDSALSEAYFIGEIPLSRAHVRITTFDGKCFEGAAQIMDDRSSVVRAIAILDGVLASRIQSSELILALLHKGNEAIKKIDLERKALLNVTRVNFEMLSANNEEDDDA